MIQEIKYEVKEEEHKEQKAWRSCCFELEPHCVAYISQFIFSTSVFGFCAVMLMQAEGDCNKSAPYINIISFMLGKILSSVLTSKD